MKLHPRGSAIVTQFQSRPEILVRVEKNHRPTTMSYAEAIFSPVMPRPTVESIRFALNSFGYFNFKFSSIALHFIFSYLTIHISRHAYSLCSSFNNFHGKMRSIFYILSDDNIGSTPRFAPGSQVQPSVITIDDEMETSGNEQTVTVSNAPSLSSQLKRKAGDLFSGSSIQKQRNLSLS